MAVDMTARARMPGTRKSTGWPVPVGSTCTAEKKRRNTTGMPRVSRSVSPLVTIMVSSARSWAMSGLPPMPAVASGPTVGRRRSPALGDGGRPRRPLRLCAAGGRPGPVGPRAGDGQVGLLQRWPVRRSPRARSRSASQPARGGHHRRARRPRRQHQPVGARAAPRRRWSRPRWPRPSAPVSMPGSVAEADRAVGGTDEARSAGVPSASIRPWSMMTTRSASRSASASSWVVRITQTPGRPLVGDDVAHHDPALGVDPGGGLVEEEHVGAGRPGPGPATGAAARPRTAAATACGAPRPSPTRSSSASGSSASS